MARRSEATAKRAEAGRSRRRARGEAAEEQKDKRHSTNKRHRKRGQDRPTNESPSPLRAQGVGIVRPPKRRFFIIYPISLNAGLCGARTIRYHELRIRYHLAPCKRNFPRERRSDARGRGEESTERASERGSANWTLCALAARGAHLTSSEKFKGGRDESEASVQRRRSAPNPTGRTPDPFSSLLDIRTLTAIFLWKSRLSVVFLVCFIVS